MSQHCLLHWHQMGPRRNDRMESPISTRVGYYFALAIPPPLVLAQRAQGICRGIQRFADDRHHAVDLFQRHHQRWADDEAVTHRADHQAAFDAGLAHDRTGENTGNKRGQGSDRSTGIKKGQSC